MMIENFVNQGKKWKDSEYWNHKFQKDSMGVFLASQSARRKWILENWGLKFDIIKPDFNEDLFLNNLTTLEKKNIFWEVKVHNHKDLIHEICSNLAIQKGLIAWKELKQKTNKFIVLSADTLVYYNQFFFTKPQTKEEAFEMLSFLSGKTHTVVTSHCILNHHKKVITKDVMSLVTFRDLSSTEIKNYIEKNESFDKAGGYAIQGEGAIFIDSIVGDYLNIVGLSLNAILFLLGEVDF